MLGCRVLLFPLPLVGHITPMLNLGKILHLRGFSVTVIHTRFNSPDPCEFPYFTFRYIEDGLLKAEPRPSDAFEIVVYLNSSCMYPFRDCLSQIVVDASKGKEPIACLILDPMWHFATTVAEAFNLPKIAIRTSGILAFVLYDALPLLREKGYFPLQEAHKEDPVPEVPPLKVKDLTSEVHHHSVLPMVKEMKRCTQGFICNTFTELEGSILGRVCNIIPSVPIFPIGPLHKYPSSYNTRVVTHDQSYLTWLNTQAPKSVLHVSFGTIAVLSKEEHMEVAWALVNSKQPFLWVVRSELIDSSYKNDQFPEDFLKNVAGRGHIIPWSLQLQVLAHPAIGGFWTHCGWNSTLESISEGVPTICSPSFGDQKTNARQISDTWQVGLQLEKGLDRQEIERAIRRLMVEKEGQEMRERAAVLKETADQCIREEGSSYKSLDDLTTHILSFTPC